ncbi:hypothetical protein E3P91_03512 [Wallemia ichthyophaga]|nr:hypothetical protein E3P91_03512 [Wallemia ichthyophaga]TIA79151.1 hypothetical protein E3P98_03467 [Wallemia ichthyophaga]TIB59510.1 hypothetical protein E3P78_03529 [Wallemia ichthyophaga]
MRLAIIGGNGFLGSAITKAAVGRGWQVSSVSQSGRPYASPSGHAPKWTSRVEWHRGHVLDAETYREVIAESDAVVHTPGILLESDYKGGVMGALNALWHSHQPPNPLSGGQYERVNRDAAMTVSGVFQKTRSGSSVDNPFVYVSAADVFRPLIPARYISTKREAEEWIAGLDGVRAVSLRPGLMYHPHTRPLSTIPATLIDGLNHLTRCGEANAKSIQHTQHMHSSQSSQSSQSSYSILNLLHTNALHIDTVANGALEAIADSSRATMRVRGIVEKGRRSTHACYKEWLNVLQYRTNHKKPGRRKRRASETSKDSDSEGGDGDRGLSSKHLNKLKPLLMSNCSDTPLHMSGVSIDTNTNLHTTLGTPHDTVDESIGEKVEKMALRAKTRASLPPPNKLHLQNTHAYDLAKLSELRDSDENYEKVHRVARKECNRHCADCRTPTPLWAVYALHGQPIVLFICIQCSGWHRSLGSHISKVKSVELDEWSAELIDLAERTGNVVGNKLYEATLPTAQIPSPSSSTSIDVGEFIRNKYLDRLWVSGREEDR